MFHLKFKDYTFLLGIGIVIAIVVVAYAQFNIRSQIQGASVVNGSVFDCRGDTFNLNVPVSNFEFHFFDHIKPGIEKECFWGASDYQVVYMKMLVGDASFNTKEMIDSMGGDAIDHRDMSDGVEIKVYDKEKREYTLGRIVATGEAFYMFVYHTQANTNFDDPIFRAFADSFQVVK